MASYQTDKDEGYPSSAPQAYAPAPEAAVPAPGGVITGSATDFSFKEPKVILRLVEAFCALVAFSCAAAANKAAQALDVYNWEEFLIATGVIALIFDISFLIVYSRGDRLPPSWAARVPVIELTLSAIWTLFFFIASIGVATLPKQYEGIPIIEPWYYGNARGAAAFGFFSCFAWGASSYLAFRRFRSGSPSGPMQYSDI